MGHPVDQSDSKKAGQDEQPCDSFCQVESHTYAELYFQAFSSLWKAHLANIHGDQQPYCKIALNLSEVQMNICIIMQLK